MEAAATTASTRARSPRSRSLAGLKGFGDRWARLWPWAPVLFAAAYGLVLLVNFSSLITAINMSADVVSAQVIGKLLSSAPSGAEVLMGHHAYYEELLFLHATAGLPHYRQLWEAVPLAWFLVGLALLTWSAWRVFGAWPAAIVASAVLCLGAAGREFFFSYDSHGLAAIHAIVLGVLVVWLVEKVNSLRVWQLALIALGAGALSALPVASEAGFLTWALVPMVATSALLLWRTRRREYWRVLAVAVAITAVALVGGGLIEHALEGRHWLGTSFGVGFAAASSVIGNTVLLVQSFLYLGGGEFFGGGMDFHALTVAVSGVLILAVLVGLLVELGGRWRNAPIAPVAYDAAQARWFAYVVFWATCLVATSVSYVFSSVPIDVTTARYVLTGYIACGALLPLLALRNRSWRMAVVAGVSVFALVAAYQIVRKPFAPANSWPDPRQANVLVRLAEREHVSVGYAGYWVAADLTWLSHFKIHVYPALLCAVPTLPPTVYCRFDEQRISSWYTPEPHIRSMLIVDPKQPLYVGSPDPLMGKPLAVRNADGLTVYIYPYDIAGHIHPGL
jgi:hypothetical protein